MRRHNKWLAPTHGEPCRHVLWRHPDTVNMKHDHRWIMNYFREFPGELRTPSPRPSDPYRRNIRDLDSRSGRHRIAPHTDDLASVAMLAQTPGKLIYHYGYAASFLRIMVREMSDAKRLACLRSLAEIARYRRHEGNQTKEPREGTALSRKVPWWRKWVRRINFI